MLKIIGLGSGRDTLLTIGALEAIETADKVFLRTANHPVCSRLRELGVKYESFDDYYNNSDNFDEVYALIVDKLIDEESKNNNIVYAVPGHPCIGEKTVVMLRERNVETTIFSAVSFIDSCVLALKIDPLDGLLIIDAAKGYKNISDSINKTMPTIISQVYSKLIASEVKLALGELYPDNHMVTLVVAAEVEGEECVLKMPLYELDRNENINHLTSVYVPPMQNSTRSCSRYPADRLVDIMELLRSPNGCPWDKQQTMESLKLYLIEETYEVIEAIESKDPQKHADELGDLLLQIVFQAQIAKEEDNFDFNNVVDTVCEKLIRRHPHVFGDVDAEDSKAVLKNWEIIKRLEKKSEQDGEESIISGIPSALPALMRALKLQSKVSRVGFDWNNVNDALKKVDEEIAEFKEVLNSNDEDTLIELGDAIFSLVNVARLLKIDPEEALRRTCDKFSKRFKYIEHIAKEQGRKVEDMDLSEMDSYWDEAKRFE